MTKLSNVQNRVSQLVSLNDEVIDKLQGIGSRFPNSKEINYCGSALVNILRFEESEDHENDGMLMFVYRYDDETDTYSLECHMEVNYRTVEDNDDRIKFAAEELSEVDPLKFVDRKVKQFLKVYEDPPEMFS